MTTSGYQRLAGQQPRTDAVSWWYFEAASALERDVGGDPFVFARGGRVPTARDARREIAACRDEARRERVAWRIRPTHRLARSGAVEAL